jgi:hypothetical protein
MLQQAHRPNLRARQKTDPRLRAAVEDLQLVDPGVRDEGRRERWGPPLPSSTSPPGEREAPSARASHWRVVPAPRPPRRIDPKALELRRGCGRRALVAGSAYARSSAGVAAGHTSELRRMVLLEEEEARG